MAITQAMIDRAVRFEGKVEFMYLDQNGNVTAGVGFLLNDAAAAAALAFYRRADMVAATDAETRVEWTAMKARPRGHVASYYDQFATLFLREADIGSQLSTRLTQFETQLANIFPKLQSYPGPAREALMDMIFNLGAGGLKKYPKLLTDVSAQEWFLAASECDRGGVAPERNAETRSLFQAAGQQSPRLEGTWAGTIDAAGVSAQATAIFTKTGSNSYEGSLAVIAPEGVSTAAMSNVIVSPPSNVAFAVEEEHFKGNLSADFSKLQGLVTGSGDTATFQFTRQPPNA